MGFLHRNPKWVNEALSLEKLMELAAANPEVIDDIREMEYKAAKRPSSVWPHAQSAPHRLAKANDIRFMQIIDEFQYMNRFIYNDSSLTSQVDLCHSYMGLAESKYAPLIVTGSYIGWLTTILNHMTMRFEESELGNLTDEEALETAYNYAGLFGREINVTTAAHIAEVANNDPFYISQMFRTKKPDLDLTTERGVRDAMQFETTFAKGFVAKVWMEYIAEGLERVNDINGKKIVLYLARNQTEEKTRDQISQDLGISDKDLADRLYKLVKADLIAEGTSDFRFKGLGDPIFTAVFRKRYAEEIERMTPLKVTAEFEREMKTAKREASWQKGQAGEYRVMYFLLLACSRGVQPEEVISNPTPGFTLNGFINMKKKTFHEDHGKKDEIDIHATSQDPDNMDLIAEVKVWERPVSEQVIEKLIELKNSLNLERKTAFLFYSENGFTPAGEKLMRENDIMYTSFKKLAGG